MALDHAKLKAVFEKALPPITDSGSLALRCCVYCWACALPDVHHYVAYHS